MFGKELVQNLGIVQMAPQDLNGAATGSAYIDLTNYGHATFVFMAGESATAAAITLKEAKDTAGTGGQALAYTKYFSNGQKLLIGSQTGTFTVGETITGGTSAATAVVSGTGQDEDIMLDRTCSSTFTYPAVTFKTYAIEVDADSLTVADGYKCVQVTVANPAGASIGAGLFILSQPRRRGVPMPSAIGTQKIVADFA